MSPEQAGGRAWERLTELESFRFTLTFHTDVPLPIEVRFAGVRERPDREAWSGYMRHRADVSRVELRAEGPDQYEKERSGWRRTIRGVETRILEQGEGSLRGQPLVFAGTERGRYLFTFRPEVPIIDPSRTKKLGGVMEVDPRSGLPLRVYCADSARTAEWELTLGWFNRGGTVEVPYEPAMTVEARPARPLSRAEFGRAFGVLNQRLARLGWDCRLRRTARGLSLLLGQPKSRRQIGLLFSRGRIEVWQGRRLQAGETTDTAATVEVGGDASRRVALDRLLAVNERIAAEVRAVGPLAAVLEVSVAAPDSTGPVVLLLDRQALATAEPDRNGRNVFQDIGSEDDVRVIAALAAVGVMPADFAVTIEP